MSTYGTALVVDLPAGSAVDPVVAGILSLGGRAWLTSAPDHEQRIVASLPEVDDVETVQEWLEQCPGARAVVAEDNDEYGALWVVLAATAEAVRTVHRRYILNADPADPDAVAEAVEDLDEDPRELDVAGEEAAAAAARLFGVEPAPVVEAERDAESAFEEIGVVGGPFPWWDALGLPWPQDGAGRPLTG